jgi:hypothetical protein
MVLRRPVAAANWMAASAPTRIFKAMPVAGEPVDRLNPVKAEEGNYKKTLIFFNESL